MAHPQDLHLMKPESVKPLVFARGRDLLLVTPKNVAESDTVQDEVNKLLGTCQFSATFEIDTPTVQRLGISPD